MRIEDHIAALRAEGELFTDVLRSASASSGLDTMVPSCPEWTVRELAHHTGRVHRWAAAYVRERLAEVMTAEEEQLVWGAMPDDAELAPWFEDGHRRLVDALSGAPADLACWSFLPAPSPLAFWARRQAHETTVHRVDAQLAVTTVSPVAVDLAVDGVDELLLGFYSRGRNRLRLDQPRTLHVVATDVGADWLVHIGPEGARAERSDAAAAREADARLAGPAPALYLALWNRGPVPVPAADHAGRAGSDQAEESGIDEALRATGDTAVIDVWRRKARVTWS